MSVTSTQGKTWALAPHLNTGVSAAEGGFETPLGRFDVAWSLDTDEDGHDVFHVQISMPPNTEGTVELPGNMMSSFVRNGNIRSFVLHGSSQVQIQGGNHDLFWKAELGMSLLPCHVMLRDTSNIYLRFSILIITDPFLQEPH